MAVLTTESGQESIILPAAKKFSKEELKKILSFSEDFRLSYLIINKKEVMVYGLLAGKKGMNIKATKQFQALIKKSFSKYASSEIIEGMKCYIFGPALRCKNKELNENEIY